MSIGELVDPTSRTVVLPNVDTTYTVGRLDLSAGPLRDRRARHRRALLRDPASRRLLEHVRLRRPPHHRHAAGLVRARAARLLGRRCRPASSAIQSPTNLVWLIGRTLVQDAADLPAVDRADGRLPRHAARRLDRRRRARPRSCCRPSRRCRPARDPDGPRLLRRSSARRSRRTRRRSGDACALRAFARGGHRAGAHAVHAGRRRRPHALAAAARAGAAIVARADATARTRYSRGAQQRLARARARYIGDYGRNWLGRAVIAKFALGANTRAGDRLPARASRTAAGAAARPPPLHGSASPRGELPPADAFWSLTMYDDDRYLRRQPDRPLRDRRPHAGAAPGPRRLAHAHDPAARAPTGAAAANWLPAPRGPLPHDHAHLRAAPLRAHGRWRPPPRAAPASA